MERQCEFMDFAIYRMRVFDGKSGKDVAEALGAENTVIDGIWVQNATGAALPHFYVTEIAFQQ